MRGILGIQLKSVVVENGQDHDKLNAEVYIDSIRVGELINDGWCDEFYIEFFNEACEFKFRELMVKYYKRKKISSMSYDYIVIALLSMCNEYRGVRKAAMN